MVYICAPCNSKKSHETLTAFAAKEGKNLQEILVFRRANNYTYAHAAFFRRFFGFVHPGEISSSR
jgi:hypothetical protein